LKKGFFVVVIPNYFGPKFICLFFLVFYKCITITDIMVVFMDCGLLEMYNITKHFVILHVSFIHNKENY